MQDSENVSGADLEAEAESIVELFNREKADYSPRLEWFAMQHDHETDTEAFVLEAESYIDRDGLSALRDAGREPVYIEANEQVDADGVVVGIEIPVTGSVIEVPDRD
jgi:hypothetical protein